MEIIELTVNGVDLLVECQIEGRDIVIFEVKIGNFAVDHMLTPKVFTAICDEIDAVLYPPKPQPNYNALLEA